MLVVAKGTYDKRSRLRASELVRKATLKLWQLMVSESTRLSEHTTKTAVGRWQRLKRATIGGAVTREGYISMHLRISKVLVFGFSLETATDMATNDWAEDITAYSGDSKIDIWLEELKKKLREDTRVEVATTGWKGLFDRYDDDGSGQIDASEFAQACRKDMDLTEEALPDSELQRLFAEADKV